MDFSLFLTIVVAAICFVFLRKLRFDPENQEYRSRKPRNRKLSITSFSLAVSTVNPPTSSSHNWIHDVFPSFRGEDVRIDFLSHIQKEFGRKGIIPFVDNNIKRGESIAPELIRAIRGSKIAIILLSKNYASSKWCLDELVEIMKCREEVGQTVMVIFYKVDPSHVKKLAGDFGEVFNKTCAGKSKEDIERWRQALVKVATIAGYDSRNWNNEATMIEKIATDVSKELINYAPSRDFDGLVGMGAHMEKVNLFLSLDSNEVKMIGIWGPSGIGKSTIARFLYSQYSHEFQLSVFMENIKRRYPNIHGSDEYSGKLQLQKEFLSQILHQDDIKINHLGVVQDRLKYKRVLVVLDDVDHSMQLDAMAKATSWFGLGSRIIVTTQDKKLLTAHGIKHVYKVDFPLDHEALQIFCTYAFGQMFPYEGFEDLAKEVTKLVGKLPLGLRVLGSHFKGMLRNEWKKELPRLRISLDGEIKSTLKFSYDALHKEAKDLFLYIACFFNNNEVEKVEAYLEKNFSDVGQGLHILAEKSLIYISSGNIKMHDLLERLGREIVCEQSIHDPGQRQFLVDARDVCRVLNNDDTLSCGSVIGTKIDSSEIFHSEEVIRSERALDRMSNLQFLRIYDNRFSPLGLNSLPRKVRLLDWYDCPMTCLPSNFNPEFLVKLEMPFSELETLWEGNKTIRNLKWMHLICSYNLRELPDLSTATNLCKLDLSWTSLVELPFSIGNAINLQKIDLGFCRNLVELPSSIGNLRNLRSLDLQCCSKLEVLPTNIKMVPLHKLDLTNCSLLKTFPEISAHTRVLKLSGTAIEEVPSSLRSWSCLEELHLSDTRIQEIAPWVKELPCLDRLVIKGCTNLVSLPQLPDSLRFLDAENCESLEGLHSSFHNAKIVDLNFANCFKLNQETECLILKPSTCSFALFPGETVPTHFTYRANGSYLSMKLNGVGMPTTSTRSVRFKACLLLVYKGDVEDSDRDMLDVYVSHCIKEKQNGVNGFLLSKYVSLQSPLLKKHLLIFDFDEAVSSSELVFEVRVNDDKWEIEECGICTPTY